MKHLLRGGLAVVAAGLLLVGCSSSSGPDSPGRVGSVAEAVIGSSTNATRGAARGQVTDTTGNGVPGVGVIVTVDGRQTDDGFSAVTDDDGFWAVGNLPPGRYRARAVLPGFGEVETEVEIEAGEVTEFEQELAEDGATGNGAIVGRVVDAADQPVVGALLELSGADLRTATDADGNFAFSGVAPGLYDLEVQVPGGEDAHYAVTISADETNELQLKLTADELDGDDDSTDVGSGTGSLSGTITDPEGNPLAGAKVELDGVDGETPTDANGDYLLEGLPAGLFLVKAEAEGFVNRTIELQLAAGENYALDIVLTPEGEGGGGGTGGTGRISGIVTDEETGDPLAFAEVHIEGLDVRVLTDEAGAYSIDELAAGTYALEIDKPFFEDEHRTVVLADGEQATLDVALPKDNADDNDGDDDGNGDDDGGDDNGGGGN